MTDKTVLSATTMTRAAPDLFTQLPTEIRHMVYEYVLSDDRFTQPIIIKRASVHPKEWSTFRSINCSPTHSNLETLFGISKDIRNETAIMWSPEVRFVGSVYDKQPLKWGLSAMITSRIRKITTLPSVINAICLKPPRLPNLEIVLIEMYRPSASMSFQGSYAYIETVTDNGFDELEYFANGTHDKVLTENLGLRISVGDLRRWQQNAENSFEIFHDGTLAVKSRNLRAKIMLRWEVCSGQVVDRHLMNISDVGDRVDGSLCSRSLPCILCDPAWRVWYLRSTIE